MLIFHSYICIVNNNWSLVAGISERFMVFFYLAEAGDKKDIFAFFLFGFEL